VKIVTICGAGIGSSGILKVNAERVLRKLDISAEVVAADIASVREVAADAQVILTSAEFVDAIGKTNASVIVIENYFDTAELTTKLETALGS
jgi:PTS system ascorbate-specific IIB component